MDYNDFFASALDELRDERRYRVFADLERIAGRFPHAIWHAPQGPREVVIWCSNDYLGMAQHPKVIGAMVETATRMGTGAGGTRNIAGTNHPLVELEQELAGLHKKPAALVFTSGYVSNQTGIATIAKLLPSIVKVHGASGLSTIDAFAIRPSWMIKQIESRSGGRTSANSVMTVPEIARHAPHSVARPRSTSLRPNRYARHTSRTMATPSPT